MDTIRFSSGVSPSDITVSRIEINDIFYPGLTEEQKGRSEARFLTDDLCLSIKGTGDRIIVDSWFSNESVRIERVEFADGTVWDVARLEETPFLGTGQDDTLTGGSSKDVFDGKAGNDTLDGGYGNDVYLFGLGDGQDTIIDQGSDSEIDTIRFRAGIAPADLSFWRDGADLHLGIGATGDAITVSGWFAGYYPSRIERMEFADGTGWGQTDLQFLNCLGDDGDNTICGTEGDDTINGLGGNDYLYGAAGDDIYLLNQGFGQDTIYDYDPTAGNLDTIKNLSINNLLAILP